MFSKRVQSVFVALVGCAVFAAAWASDQFLGAWTGTWEGGGSSGTLVLTLKKSDGALGGKVDVGQDMGDYSSTLSTASFEGNKLTARYDYTPDPQAEIVLEGAFEGTSASGTWSMVQKGGNEAFMTGTWALSKD